MSSIGSKKRKSSATSSTTGASDSNNNGSSNKRTTTSSITPAERHANSNYTPLSLQDIYDRIAELCQKLPMVPEDGFVLQDSTKPVSNGTAEPPIVTSLAVPASSNSTQYDHVAIKVWATSVQCVLEEFALLSACISPATYVWGTDRSGAADQNLTLLSNELMRTQEQISARVTPRLNDVLAPVVTLITTKTVTTKQDASEIKQSYYATTFEDPDYVNWCFSMLARNAILMRQVVLANFDKLLEALRDFTVAQHSDSQHDSRGLLY